MKQKELIEYKKVDLADANSVYLADEYVQAIELFGHGDVFKLAEVFLFWKNKVREITYRFDAESKALVVFSLLEDEDYVRSIDVLQPIRWREDDLEVFLSHQRNDTEEIIVIDLSQYTLSQNTQDAHADQSEKMSLIDFLRYLYAINPRKKRIELQGDTHPFLLLIILDWFCGHGGEIFYNNQRLS